MAPSPHHAGHAGRLEQQEPPVSGLPQHAQETDLGHRVVGPGEDDTEEAQGRLERITKPQPFRKLPDAAGVLKLKVEKLTHLRHSAHAQKQRSRRH